uniref:Alternative protein PCDHGB3 n=1 Tax=Homo sapiens TaxID=9606 RepID=L0R6M0_HUMAN|nr:alternative protein PCDHGB3 [Homo sapiens]
MEGPSRAEANAISLPALFVRPGSLRTDPLRYSRGAGQGLAGREPRQGPGVWRGGFTY